MTGENFVAQLPSVFQFADVADPSRFTPAPDDWRLYCCDVVNSTQAIEQGRYKAVNMMGAACIMAAINAAKSVPLAFVFGGDGATILAPDALAPDIDRALARTRRMAQDAFALNMRVGAVPVSEIRGQEADVRIAMLELSPGNRTAAFSGGGAALADRLVKADIDGKYAVPESDDEDPDVEGLSCRWEPLAARHGHMVCILAAATSADGEKRVQVYRDLIADIEQILQPDVEAAQPVRADNMHFRWPPRSLGLETLATRRGKSRWAHRLELLTQSFFQAIAEWFDRKIGDYNAPVYRGELRANSDYRRFDDTLRLVLDCTPEQFAAIEHRLAAAHRQGEIVYGVHLSDSALMTCLLFDLKESSHLHFVDGADGGFTFAARAMKDQIAAQKP